MQREQEAAKRRGSEALWLVFPHYRVQNGLLENWRNPDHRYWSGNMAERTYHPVAHPEIVMDFSRLKEGDEKAVLRFAHKWGLLGYDNLISDHPGWITKDGKLLREERKEGDPLTWIWAHAETLRRLLRLIELLRSDWDTDNAALRSHLHDMEEPVAPDGPRYLPWRFQTESYGTLLYPYSNGINPSDVILVPIPLPGSTAVALYDFPRGVALQVLRSMLNSNLAGARPGVEMHWEANPESETLERTIFFPALLSVIYWHLSNAAVGEKVYLQCSYCHEWFQREDSRQRYCPPYREGAESPCALKSRQNIHRRKRAEAQPLR